MRKTICIISNIVLSYFYVSTSWMLSLAALFYMTALNWQNSTVEALWFVGLCIIALTPIFCILGIVISIVKWVKERYLGAFLVQFLPFGTLALSVLFFIVPVWIINLGFHL
ncbi:MAG: hypothetical protein IKV02_00460 [Clostridia bacterium]|nr:hypothetical protein [Clostridia bacterium]